MKKTVFFVACLLIISSCSSNKNEEIVSTIAAGGESEKELQESLREYQKEEEKRLKEEAESLTTVSFDKMTHDFGTVKQDSDNKTVFTVTNTGKKPLIIEKVEASCGCTTPQKPESPILPGKSDVIKVTFHPKPGQTGEIDKKVAVTANTEKRIIGLTIKAFVK